MAPGSFHLFPLLPPEIRILIYWLATPSRFVHVREEHEDEDEFHERFRTNPMQIMIHPSIAHFVDNWRDRLPHVQNGDGYRQPTLGAYGFNVPKLRHQPWEPTSNLPTIPHACLADSSKVAWEFSRSGFFYSCAPIPVMLQVWRESRQFLIDVGYELSFGTRTHGPRIWFNYQRDVLYLERYHASMHHYQSSPDFHALLSGNTLWDLGQFHPDDLARVRRLGLHQAYQILVTNDRRMADLNSLSNILRLFGGIEEIFFEESDADYFEMHFDRAKGNSKAGTTATHEEDVWCFTEAKNVDLLAALHHHRIVLFAGNDGTVVPTPLQESVETSVEMYDDFAARLESKLAEHKKETRSLPCEQQDSWRTPKIRIVHIGYPWMIQELFRARRTWWDLQQYLRDRDAIDNAMQAAHESMDTIPRRPIYSDREIADGPVSPFTERYADDWEAHEADAAVQYYHAYHDSGGLGSDKRERQVLLGLPIAQPT